MAPNEIATSEDVDHLYTQLRAAKAFDDHATVRLIEARMRDLAGHNTRSDERRGRAVAADGAALARFQSACEAGATG